MSRRNKNEDLVDDPTMEGANVLPLEEAQVATVKPQNKATRLADLIRQGGKTKEDLMEGIEVNAAGFASQLSYLNTRGLNIAEVAQDKAEFPMKDSNGVYYMGSYAEYIAKRGEGSAFGKVAKTRTPVEAVVFAQKREDTASAKVTRIKDKLDKNPEDAIYQLELECAQLELQLAGAKLAQVEAGDYSYESFRVE